MHRADSFHLQHWPSMLSSFLVIDMFKGSWSKTPSGSRANDGHAVQFSYQRRMNFRSKEASRPGLVICWLNCTSTGHHSERHSVFLNEERRSMWLCFAVRMSCVMRPVAVGRDCDFDVYIVLAAFRLSLCAVWEVLLGFQRLWLRNDFIAGPSKENPHSCRKNVFVWGERLAS